jgi:hypothetical protein
MGLSCRCYCPRRRRLRPQRLRPLDCPLQRVPRGGRCCLFVTRCRRLCWGAVAEVAIGAAVTALDVGDGQLQRRAPSGRPQGPQRRRPAPPVPRRADGSVVEVTARMASSRPRILAAEPDTRGAAGSCDEKRRVRGTLPARADVTPRARRWRVGDRARDRAQRGISRTFPNGSGSSSRRWATEASSRANLEPITGRHEDRPIWRRSASNSARPCRCRGCSAARRTPR